mmetsp:Transcript_49970/g.132073  ORF Transcript_49970/g.132073 Transcript_49970/m.132073 type:complete len:355 (-) Transcript_49970:389-1453(-)
MSGLSSWLAGQSASRLAPMSMKTPNGAARTTVPWTSAPTLRLARGTRPSALPASEDDALERPSREDTSIWPCSSLTCVTMRPSCSSPTLYSVMSLGSMPVRQSAAEIAPTSKKRPIWSMRTTLPVTVEPRIIFPSGMPRSDFVLTEILLPSTLKTVRSATSPMAYSDGDLERYIVGPSTSLERPTSKKTPNSATFATVPSIVSPTLTESERRRVVTSICSFCLLMLATLRPETLSPTLYSPIGLESWFVLQRASRGAPTLKKMPNAGLIEATVPVTSAPILMPSMEPLGTALPSRSVLTVTRSPSTLTTFTFMVSPSAYSAGGLERNCVGARTSLPAPMLKKTPNLAPLRTVPS